MCARSNDKIQEEVYIKVIDLILKQEGMSFESLSELTDGVKLPRLAEILLGEKIKGWKENPKVFQRAPNVKAVTDYLATKDRMLSMSFDLNTQKDALGFIWVVLSKFYIVRPKKDLINIFAYLLSDYESTIPIKNMSKCWAGGLPFIALACKMSNGEIPFEDKGDGNYDYISQACQKLNIPFVLTPACICASPDENCMCLQSFLFLKAMGDIELPANLGASPKKPVPAAAPAPAPTPAAPKAAGGSLDRLKMRTDEYIAAAQAAIDALNKESEAVDAAWLNRSVDGVKQLGVVISNFNRTGLKACKDLVSKARPIWETVGRLANSNKVPVPEVPVDYAALNQKVADLEKRCNDLRANLEADSAEMASWQKRIEATTSVEEAQKVFDEIPYDKTNWRDLPPKSIMHLAGARIDYFNNAIANAKSNAISEFNAQIAAFNEKADGIPALMKLNAADPDDTLKRIDASQRDIDALKELIPKIAAKHAEVTEMAPEENVAMPDLQKRIDELEALKQEAVVPALGIITDARFDKAQKELEPLLELVRAYAALEKVYDADKIEAASKAAHDSGALDAAIAAFKKSFEELAGRAETKHTPVEADGLVATYKGELDPVDARFVPVNKALKDAMPAARKAKGSTLDFGNIDENIAVSKLLEARAALEAAQAEKTWPEDATGPLIKRYDEEIEEAVKRIDDETKRLKELLTKTLVKIDNAVSDVEACVVETSSVTIDVAGYERAQTTAGEWLQKIDAVITRQNALQVEGHDPVDAKARLEKASAEIKELMAKAPGRIQAQLDGIKAEINTAIEKLTGLVERVPVECARIVEETNELDEYEEEEPEPEPEPEPKPEGGNGEEEDKKESNGEEEEKKESNGEEEEKKEANGEEEEKKEANGEEEEKKEEEEKPEEEPKPPRERHHKIQVIPADCTIEEAAEKCEEVFQASVQLRDLIESVEKVKKIFGISVDVPDTTEIFLKAKDIHLLHKASLFFQPEARSASFVEELPELEDPYIVLAAAIIAMKEFEGRQCSVPLVGDFSVASETIAAVFDTLSEDFIETTSGLAIKMMTPGIARSTIQDIELMIDALALCTEDAVAYVCKVQPTFTDREDVAAKSKALEENKELTHHKVLVEAMDLYRKIINERAKGFINGDPVVVLDIGVYGCRAGFADDENPDLIWRASQGGDFKSKLEAALAHKAPRPGQKGQNDANMEDDIDYALKKLTYKEGKTPVLLVGRDMMYNGPRLVQHILETFPVFGVSAVETAVGIVLTTQRTTGVAIDIGDQGFTVTPVVDGNAVAEAERKGELGGNQLTMALQAELYKQGNADAAGRRKATFDELREEYCYVRLNDSDPIKSDPACPDACAVVPEQLFVGSQSLQNLIQQAIEAAAEEVEVDPVDLYANIVLAGGVAKTRGLRERLEKELGEANVFVADHPELTPYNGACLFAHMSTFDSTIITRSMIQME